MSLLYSPRGSSKRRARSGEDDELKLNIGQQVTLPSLKFTRTRSSAQMLLNDSEIPQFNNHWMASILTQPSPRHENSRVHPRAKVIIPSEVLFSQVMPYLPLTQLVCCRELSSFWMLAINKIFFLPLPLGITYEILTYLPSGTRLQYRLLNQVCNIWFTCYVTVTYLDECYDPAFLTRFLSIQNDRNYAYVNLHELWYINRKCLVSLPENIHGSTEPQQCVKIDTTLQNLAFHFSINHFPALLKLSIHSYILDVKDGLQRLCQALGDGCCSLLQELSVHSSSENSNFEPIVKMFSSSNCPPLVSFSLGYKLSDEAIECFIPVLFTTQRAEKLELIDLSYNELSGRFFSRLVNQLKLQKNPSAVKSINLCSNNIQTRADILIDLLVILNGPMFPDMEEFYLNGSQSMTDLHEWQSIQVGRVLLHASPHLLLDATLDSFCELNQFQILETTSKYD